MVVIEDGTGTGRRVKVTPSNGIRTQAITEIEDLDASKRGG